MVIRDVFCERGNIVRNGWRGTLVADTQAASYIEMIEVMPSSARSSIKPSRL